MVDFVTLVDLVALVDLVTSFVLMPFAFDPSAVKVGD